MNFMSRSRSTSTLVSRALVGVVAVSSGALGAWPGTSADAANASPRTKIHVLRAVEVKRDRSTFNVRSLGKNRIVSAKLVYKARSWRIDAARMRRTAGRSSHVRIRLVRRGTKRVAVVASVRAPRRRARSAISTRSKKLRVVTIPPPDPAPTTEPAPAPSPDGFKGLMTPIDPTQQTLLEFGDRSHWLQPWRGYLDTVPATKLRDALGINIGDVPAAQVPALARLLAASGIKRVRYEIGWGSIDFDDPTRLSNADAVRTVLSALRDNGIRPLILLNSHHGIPTATRAFDAGVTAPAARGARQLRLDASTVAAAIPGRTGLNSLTGEYKAAEFLFTSINGDVATLSKPLPRDIATGTYRAATLKYEPFGPPRLTDGSPNPRFERTLAGWLDYVGVVTRQARDLMGNDNFDVEIWNELSFGSDFLYSERYYETPPVAGSGDVTRVIPERTVKWLRDPANGVSGVGITNGFESQRPWASGATSPVGLTGISKHPYMGIRRFPQDAANHAAGNRPLNALGEPDGVYDPATNSWRDNFVPTYDSFFPEYHLSAVQTEHLVRDLSPITTDVYGTPHGRFTKPDGGAPPAMWVTEWNLDPTGADPSDPANLDAGPIATLSEADRKHLQAKGALRFFTSWVNKGGAAAYLYAAKHGNLSLVDPAFFTALQQNGGAYPGDQLGGETMDSIRRLSQALTGAVELGETRTLSLIEVSDNEHRKQFEGDGTAGHPTLYDRDVTAFHPYQVNDRRFVIPTYVATRNIAKLYRPTAPASDPTRYDLPESSYRLTIGGLRSSGEIRVGATDPLSSQTVPVRIVSREADRVVVELPLTDSPRLLTIDEVG